MKDTAIFGLVRALLVVGAGIGLWLLIPQEQRNELGYIVGMSALVVGFIGVRWLIAHLLGGGLKFLGRWEVK